MCAIARKEIGDSQVTSGVATQINSVLKNQVSSEATQKYGDANFEAFLR
jgi:hypothetical protein